jgi:hypothetical protein
VRRHASTALGRARGTALVVGLVVLGLTLGACSGGSSDDGDGLTARQRTVADNLTAEILRSGTVTGQDAVTAKQADCVARGTVQDLGVARLRHYGIVTADLKVDKTVQGVRMDRGDSMTLARVFVRCIDTEGLFEGQFLHAKSASRLTAEQRRCIKDAIDRKAVLQALALSFQGRDHQVYAGLRKRLARCA